MLDGIGSIDPIELTLLDAQGLLLAENVSADFPLPSFDNSAMDGYAVRAIDTRDGQRARTRCGCRSSATSPPGRRPRSGMGPGLAMRIMTGAPIPAGADAVIPLEDTDRGLARVAIHRPVRTGECVRRAGEDLAGRRARARRRRRAGAAADRAAGRHRPRPGRSSARARASSSCPPAAS